jgi:hypothetical protein
LFLTVPVTLHVRAEEPASEGEAVLSIDNFDDAIDNNLFTIIEFYAQG